MYIKNVLALTKYEFGILVIKPIKISEFKVNGCDETCQVGCEGNLKVKSRAQSLLPIHKVGVGVGN